MAKKQQCKHNGGRGYWSNLSGSVCLLCGEEVQSKSKKGPEITCVECHKVSVPDYSKWGCIPNLCDECSAKGWEPATLTSFVNDPLLRDKVDIVSPILKTTTPKQN